MEQQILLNEILLQATNCSKGCGSVQTGTAFKMRVLSDSLKTSEEHPGSGYLTQHICNADILFAFWKTKPDRTYINKEKCTPALKLSVTY